jgi:hypothetical protein
MRKIESPQACADQIAKLILQNDRSARTVDKISISVGYSFDIGIASSYLGGNYYGSPDAWSERVIDHPKPADSSTLKN